MKLERDWEWEEWDKQIRCVWRGTKDRPKPQPVEEIPDDPEKV